MAEVWEPVGEGAARVHAAGPLLRPGGANRERHQVAGHSSEEGEGPISPSQLQRLKVMARLCTGGVGDAL